jgi:hypothetical protein
VPIPFVLIIFWFESVKFSVLYKWDGLGLNVLLRVTHRSWPPAYQSVTCWTGKEHGRKRGKLASRVFEWQMVRRPAGPSQGVTQVCLVTGSLTTLSVLQYYAECDDEWVRNCMKEEEVCRGLYRSGCLGGLRKLTKNRSQHNQCRRGTDKSKHCHFSQSDEKNETSVYAWLHDSGIYRRAVW